MWTPETSDRLNALVLGLAYALLPVLVLSGMAINLAPLVA